MRVLFQNFTYKFAGTVYVQQEGGPIGARVTMAAGRLVMLKWGEDFRISLEVAKMEICLLGGYVDDVRLAGTQIRYGMRYSMINGEWEWSEYAWKEDIRMKCEGEHRDDRMRRICLSLMNDLNKDLKFTAEVAGDFATGRLPTLDFELWVAEDGSLQHNYFQKAMKTPFVVMRRSAMAQQQKLSILSNELVRRLSNTEFASKDHSERVLVIDQYTSELKVSEYNRLEVKEIICCGIRGWKSRGELRRMGRSTEVQQAP